MSYDSFKDITIQQMEMLIALIESGSFTRAAGKLFLTQPTLTKQIRNLEESVGARLVNRGGTGISLTPEGQIFYTYAKRVVRLREDTREKLGRLRENESGHIYISASTIPATYILPRLLGRLKTLYPDICVHIQMNDSEDTHQMVLNEHAGMGFIGKEVFDRKLITERLWKDSIVLVVPSHHPWAKTGDIPVESLTKEPFVLRERGSATRDAFEECLLKNFNMSLSSLNVVCEMGSSEAVKEAIMAGLGVSVLSIYAIEREMGKGNLAIVPIKGCAIERFFYLIYRKNFPLMNYHRRFLEVLRKSEPL
ncbi:MAG: LysR family transcriptional regulator [Deltaproteobacteria bacterium]|nr:LysR family transcriptional regulator [Deltaproteobacteria bacterium]